MPQERICVVDCVLVVRDYPQSEQDHYLVLRWCVTLRCVVLRVSREALWVASLKIPQTHTHTTRSSWTTDNKIIQSEGNNRIKQHCGCVAGKQRPPAWISSFTSTGWWELAALSAALPALPALNQQILWCPPRLLELLNQRSLYDCSSSGNCYYDELWYTLQEQSQCQALFTSVYIYIYIYT